MVLHRQNNDAESEQISLPISLLPSRNISIKHIKRSYTIFKTSAEIMAEAVTMEKQVVIVLAGYLCWTGVLCAADGKGIYNEE
jgi:hypothetical protein